MGYTYPEIMYLSKIKMQWGICILSGSPMPTPCRAHLLQEVFPDGKLTELSLVSAPMVP